MVFIITLRLQTLLKEGQGAKVMQVATKQNINIESIKATIASKIDSAAFQTWIDPLQLSVCQNCLNVVAQNQFTADYVKREYGKILGNIAADFSLDINIYMPIFALTKQKVVWLLENE